MGGAVFDASVPATPDAPASLAPDAPASPALVSPHAPFDAAAAFGQILGVWGAALASLSTALNAYCADVGTSGQRVVGSRWGAALAALAETNKLLASCAALGHPAPAAPFVELLDAADLAETCGARYRAAAAVLLDARARSAVESGMSRTFSEELGGLLARVAAADLKVDSVHHEALRAASLAGSAAARALTLSEAASSYAAGTARGGVATELYLGALLCARSDPLAALLIDATKDCALGSVADSLSAAERDAAALLEYHPLQAMPYAPHSFMPQMLPDGNAPTLGPLTHASRTLAAARSPAARSPAAHLPAARSPAAHLPAVAPARSTKDGRASASAAVSAPRAENGRTPVLDLTLPHARLSVTYNLLPLISRQYSLEFGPIASMSTGLNYKLIERLRTIRALPLPARPSASSRSAEISAPRLGPLLVSVDGGATAQTFAPAAGYWAPLSGARPRVAAYACASECLILAQIRSDRAAGWSPDIRVDYETAVSNDVLPKGECGAEALIVALVSGFGDAYDLDPPQDSKEFYKLVVGDEPRPGDYVTAAISLLGAAALEKSLYSNAGSRVPSSVASRELRTSQVIQAIDSGRALWRRIRDAFVHEPEAFAVEGVRRREMLLHAFRRMVRVAVSVAPVICFAPSLKKFAVDARAP
jgi:hypothetical protein